MLFFNLVSQSIDFSNVIIDDGLLGSLLEYPTSAFEIVTDPETRRKTIQIKKSYKVLHSSLKEIFSESNLLEFIKLPRTLLLQNQNNLDNKNKNY